VAGRDLSKAKFDIAPGSPKFVACTGAISDEFFNSHTGLVDQATGTSHNRQWNPKMGRYDLVTMSFGGNDIGFASILTHCLDHQGCPSDAAVREKITQLGTTGVYKGKLHIPAYPTFLKHVATAAVVKGGNVVVMGYPEIFEDPTLWGPKETTCAGNSATQANIMRGWGGDLNATLGNSVGEVNALPASQRNGVHFTFLDAVSGQAADGISASDPDLFEPSSGIRHELCSQGHQTWMNGFSETNLNGSFHPNQDGANAMGNLLAKVVPTLSWPWTTSVPISACPTTLNGGPAKALPDTAAARVPLGGIGPVSLYSDTTATTQLLAPSGWNCQAVAGGDGTTTTNVWPQGAPAPINHGIQGEGIEGYVIPGANVFGQYELVCSLFPSSLTAALNGTASGASCGPNPPSTETDTTLNAQTIAFHDPPGVIGTWDNSSNTNPADGIVIFNTEPQPNSEMAVCILPASLHDVCTAALNNFAVHYGELKLGTTGTPTNLPAPTTTTTTTAPSGPCDASLLFQAAVAKEGFDPNDPSYAQMSPDGAAGAYDPICDANWAVASISRPNVGTTDGETVFNYENGSWVEVGQTGGDVAQCNLETAGVPADVALVLAQGVVHSGLAGC
jgi:hypothetical protein